MNDLMSFGVHRLWKRFALSLTGLKPGQRALDVAGGTGDLALGMLRQVGKEGRVVLSDINPNMLEWVGTACSTPGSSETSNVWSRTPNVCRSRTIRSIA